MTDKQILINQREFNQIIKPLIEYLNINNKNNKLIMLKALKKYINNNIKDLNLK